MAIANSNGHALIPAVAYVRRSTNRQEKSLDDQRREIEAYAAAHGFRIVRWFEDDGISGDSTEQRRGFQAMHKAACNGRDFDVILCWDFSRFGRFNAIEAGFWIHSLVKAGVRLVTVAEGAIEWTNFTGRIVNAIQAEGKHQYLTDLSRNVARGLIGIASKGYLCGQAAPYGYDRMLVDENGNHRQRLTTGERFAKPRSWHAVLVPSEDAAKVQTVQWLFTTYASTDTGLRSLADQLNARGVSGPGGGAWYAATIRAILDNRNYTGTFTWAKRREGKYHSVASGQIQKRDAAEVKLSRRGKPTATDNPREAWIVVKGAHQGIVDAATFEKVQAKLQERKRSTPGIGYRSHTRANDDAYLLSGLVFCAQCGCKMHGATLVRNKNGKQHKYPKYLCSTYQRSGKNNPAGCGCHGVHQDQLVDVLVRKVRQRLIGSDFARLKASLRKQLSARRSPDTGKLDTLRRQHSDRDRQIDVAADNFLKAPPDLLDLVAGKLSAMKRQREHLQGELRRMEREAEPVDVEAEVDAAAAKLRRLGEELQTATDARCRQVFRELVDRIELRFDRQQRGKRVECPLAAGTIVLRPDAGIFGSVSRGDCPTVEPLNAMVDAFVQAMLALAPHEIFSLSEAIGSSFCPQTV
jgi:site-specific DNA recombinase